MPLTDVKIRQAKTSAKAIKITDANGRKSKGSARRTRQCPCAGKEKHPSVACATY